VFESSEHAFSSGVKMMGMTRSNRCNGESYVCGVCVLGLCCVLRV